MNIRLGFQRLYAVLTVAWFGLVLLAAPRDKLKFWEADRAAALTPDSFMAAQRKPATPVGKGDWFEQNAPDQPARDVRVPPSFTPDNNSAKASSAAPVDLSAYRTVSEKAPAGSVSSFGDKGWQDVPNAADARGWQLVSTAASKPPADGETPLSKVTWLGGILFLRPAIGYLLLFHVLRWVYRGFRPAV